jgi:hypothetical protein
MEAIRQAVEHNPISNFIPYTRPKQDLQGSERKLTRSLQPPGRLDFA